MRRLLEALIVMRVGVLATVPWRAPALRKAAASLARQTLKLDELLFFVDGRGPLDQDAIALLREAAHTVRIEQSPETSGPWERLRRADVRWKGSGASAFVFDDDLRYPPRYVEALDMAMSRCGGVVALGGALTSGGFHSFNALPPLSSDAPAIELQLGVSCMPIPVLDGAHREPEIADLLGPGFLTEAALAYWWWKNGVQLTVVADVPTPQPIILPEGGATDPRSLYIACGRDRRTRAWATLTERVGWPACARAGQNADRQAERIT